MTVNERYFCSCLTVDPKNEWTGSKAHLLLGYKWPVGGTISIRFLEGAPALQERVKEVARTWTDIANLTFDWRESGPTDLRIAFEPGNGSWSYLGTQCRWIKEPIPTMNFGWLTPTSTDYELRRVVLHEFGHALGLIHEHQNPKGGGIKWNVDAVVADLRGPPNFWTLDAIENNMFKKYSETQVAEKWFDAKSIMMHPIPRAWTLDGTQVGLNSELSTEDRAFIAGWYPNSPPDSALPTSHAKHAPAPSIPSNVRRGGLRSTEVKQQIQRRMQEHRSERAPRWILAKVLDLSAKPPKKPTPAFHADAKHEIQVIIGAEQPDWLAARGRDASQSIDSMLPKGTHELTVVFFLPDSGTQTGKLILPPNGPTSKPAKFRFDVGPAGSRIEALISIVHRGRVLQTAMLSGLAVADPLTAPEEARISLRLQVVVPGFEDLDRREAFDVALVAAKGASKSAVAAGVVHSEGGRGKTLYFKQPRIDKAAQSIRAVLEDVVTDETLKNKLDSEAAQSLLWKLAQQGRILYESIGERLEEELAGRDLSRLQLVQADPSAFIPIEFVYDLPAPANGAPLCKNWKGALTGQPCTANHHEVDALGHLKVVCPSGFWSVSKVIERQILEDLTAEEMEKSDFGVRAEPSAARPSLPPMGSALFAWSEILDNSVAGTSADLLKSLDEATKKQAAPVKTWLKWAEAIDKRHPALLVLLSHTVDDALEIGPEDSGERATVAQINGKFVKSLAQDAPIVFLLGCDTAVADDKLVSFVGRFRDKGAALVVGTITPVLGEHSAMVVKTVVAKLAQKRDHPTSFGELMRDARRDLLSKGELTALCATSFGDASWLVT